MRQDLARKKYDSFWEKRKGDDFFSYERNRRLNEFFQERGRVLDVACGSGTVALWLQNKGFEVIGIDISQKALNLAKKKGLKKVIQADVEEKLPFKAQSFDYVFCGDILEHLIDPLGLLKESRRVLKKKGRLILSIPNMGYWYYRLAYLVKGQVTKTEGEPSKPWEWGHIRFFNYSILCQLLEEAGFVPQKLIGVCRKPPDNFLARYWPQIFASIFIIEAKKP